MKTKRVCAGLGNIILDLDLMAVSKLPNALRIRGAVGDSENCWAKMDIVLIFCWNWGPQHRYADIDSQADLPAEFMTRNLNYNCNRWGCECEPTAETR